MPHIARGTDGGDGACTDETGTRRRGGRDVVANLRNEAVARVVPERETRAYAPSFAFRPDAVMVPRWRRTKRGERRDRALLESGLAARQRRRRARFRPRGLGINGTGNARGCNVHALRTRMGENARRVVSVVTTHNHSPKTRRPSAWFPRRRPADAARQNI